MRLIVSGTVQGVGFRPAVYRAAVSSGLRGRVWNDGPDVVIDTDDADLLMSVLRDSLPPLASIDCVRTEDVPFDDGTEGFSIVPSEPGSGGSSVPTDTAMCGRCLSEMLGDGRRRGYPFTSCTDCGPRFTLLRGIPYDRRLTSMDAFGMCPDCGREYADPDDRRFHHQTVCCPFCGPSYRLEDEYGHPVPGDPLSGFAGLLEKGGIGVIKSWGGMHICCTAENTRRMREWYGRRSKPFALMVKDAEAVRRYGRPTAEEAEQLESDRRPIVLVEKEPSDLTDALAPGLDNIGLFLPYTGMQHLLFRELDADALVMTSANAPGEPMMLDDADVIGLGADMYLLHDQGIANRADDSVLRMFGDRTFFIRRSRGHIPFRIGIPLRGSAVALGAQENLAGAVAKDGRIYPTQHIGNGGSVGVEEYLEEAVRFQMSMVGCVPDAVAVDLHPGYSNRRLAKRLAQEYGAQLVEVQHHWAHAASLMADSGTDRMAALTLDGTGYGDDGSAWGGEVLAADLDSYRRVAHLECIPLLGSDRALHDLRRLRFAVDMMNGTENRSFDDREASVLSKMMGRSVGCSSMGRFLDTVSYSLGVCTERTYDGEPAMRLEPLLARGRLIPGFETGTVSGVIRTAELFTRISDDMKPADVAYSMVHSVMSELVENAVECAESEGIGSIGITGGVSYNTCICRMFSELARDSGKDLIFHRTVPNGDGGISAGQAAVALKLIG